MKKWQSTLLMVLAGIGPVTVAIVCLQQASLIGIDTALLLGLLYLLFVSTHVWCRIFTKIPPPPTEPQVDSLPCYEEAVKSEPPSYYSLYPESREGSAAVSVSAGTPSAPTESKSTSVHLERVSSQSDVDNNSRQSSTADLSDEALESCPVFGRHDRRLRSFSGPPILLPAQASAIASAASNRSPSSPGISYNAPEEENRKKEKFFTKILGNIVNPVDHV